MGPIEILHVADVDADPGRPFVAVLRDIETQAIVAEIGSYATRAEADAVTSIATLTTGAPS